MTEHPATGLRGPRIELGTERESLLQMLDEDADFRGQPAASRPNRKDRHRSFKGGGVLVDFAPRFSGACQRSRLKRSPADEVVLPRVVNVFVIEKFGSGRAL